MEKGAAGHALFYQFLCVLRISAVNSPLYLAPPARSA
jgi:hypothetical protein